ncbi:hypothetical protein BX666DRAFT_1860872 [Dichotomocladium elegans]|nr:hypothetical protein BX666DRAFT_1860872 [Dichotomocladium elegans]
MDLLSKLQKTPPSVTQTAASGNVSYQKAIKVTLYPSIGGFPSAWEFTLIVVVALLAVSFLASVGMHYHLWRLRRRQREMMLENGVLPVHLTPLVAAPKKTVIDPEMLAIFSVRTIAEDQNNNRRNSGSSDQKEGELVSIKVTDAVNQHDSSAVLSQEEDMPVRTLRIDSHDSDMCVICLDSFMGGEKVRKLPCGHEFHCECIGKLL